jgi:hypothetical protein
MVDSSGHVGFDARSELDARARARARVERKHKLRADVGAYLVINAILVVVWAVSGAGYFWPGWILGVWGVFLLLDAWNIYFRRPVTDQEIDAELRRMR